MTDFVLSAFADEASESLEGQITALKRNGISHMEIRGVGGKPVIDYSEEEIKKIAGALSKEGISVSAVGSPIGKVNITDDLEAHFKRFCHTVEAARILGANRIRMFSFYLPEGADPEDYAEKVYGEVSRMCDYAGEKGVICCHENEKGIFGDTAPRVKQLYDHCAGLRGVFDPANFVQCGEVPGTFYKTLLPYTEYLHIKDAYQADGCVVPAGEGDGSVPEVIEGFYSKNSGRVLSVEPHLTHFVGLSSLQKEELKGREGYQNADEAFDAAVNALKTILDKRGYCYE